MKYFLGLILFVIGSFSFSQSLALRQTITLDIPSMFCQTCPITVRKSLEKVEGVIEVVTDLDNKTTTVTFDSTKTNVEQLIEATTNAGYPSTQFIVFADEILIPNNNE